MTSTETGCGGREVVSGGAVEDGVVLVVARAGRTSPAESLLAALQAAGVSATSTATTPVRQAIVTIWSLPGDLVYFSGWIGQHRSRSDRVETTMTAVSPELDGGPRADPSMRPAVDATQGGWVFVGKSSLPSDLTARQHEKRGRRWLLVSYFLCPCHVPITLALIGAALGGTTLGAAITGNALRVGVVLSGAYGLVLWRGFRQIRWAKRVEAAGGTVTCEPEGCTVTSRTE